MASNFTSGALVFRVWGDGSGDVLAKFQYMNHARDYADSQAKSYNLKAGDIAPMFIAVCETDNELKAFVPRVKEAAG